MEKLYEKNKGLFITIAVIIFILVIVGVILLIQWWQNKDNITRGTGKSKGGENNPMNIRASNTKWLGEVDPGFKTDFENFSTPADGYRAGFVTIYNYIKNGADTLTKILNKYAPPSENDTQAYIDQVSKYTGIDPNAQLNTKTFSGPQGVNIIIAMSRIEQGKQPVQKDVNDGYYLFQTTYLS